MSIIKKQLRLFLLFLFLVWFGISLFRLGNNYINFFLKDSRFLTLSEKEKYTQEFGSVYTTFKTLSEKTNRNSTILLLSSNGQDYYLGRYILYPTKLYWAQNAKDFKKLSLQKKFNYYYIANNEDLKSEEFSSQSITKIGKGILITL